MSGGKHNSGLGFSLWTDFLVDVAEALVIRHVEFGIHLLWNSVRNGDTQAKGHQIESKDSPSKIAQGQGPEVEHLMTERRHHNQSSFTNPDVRFPQWEGPPLGASLSSSQEVESKSARPNKMDRKIFVRNINYRTSQTNLWQFFEKFGTVGHCRLLWDDQRRRSRGKAIVTFKSEEAVASALSASEDQLLLDYRNLQVERAERKQREGVEKRMKNNEANEDKEQFPTFDYTPSIAVDSLTIHQLNSDILQLIFSYLSLKEKVAIESVCKHWSQESLQSWKSIRKLEIKGLVKRFGGISDDILKAILRRTNPVCFEELDLSVGGRSLTDKAIENIGLFCPNLKKLNLAKLDIRNRCLRAVAEHCPHLQEVFLNDSSYLGEDGFWWLLHRCKELQKVVLAGNKRLKGQCLHVACKSIRHLDLDACSKLQDVGLKKVALRCPDIKELHISECLTITDEGVQVITKECTSLTVLHLKRMKDVTRVGFTSVENLHCLQELHLTSNQVVDDDVLISIARGCPKLRILDISICYAVTSRGVASLRNCQLTDLDISYITTVTDEGVLPIFKLGLLERLTCRACSGISDEAMKCLAAHCCHLAFLDVSGCMQFHAHLMESFDVRKTARDTHLKIIAGGTTIVKQTDSPEMDLTVSYDNRCIRNYRRDTDLYVDMGTDDEDESTESEDRGENGGEGDDIECRGGNEMWEASASYAGASAELETKVEELTLIKDATGVEDSFNEAVPSDGDILQGPPPPTAFVPAGAEDGDEMDLYCGDVDDFLENDDPCWNERWEMS